MESDKVSERSSILSDRDKSRDTCYNAAGRGIDVITVTEPTYTIIIPKCAFLVGPLIAMIFFCSLGAIPLVEQYIYARYARDFPVLHNNTNSSISETCRHINSSEQDGAYNATQEVQAKTSQQMMYLKLLTSVPSLFTTLIIGGYSDVLYRKPALIIVVIGQVIRGTVILSVVYFNLNLYYITGAFLIDGCCGGAGAQMMASFSYIAEITPIENRALRIVVVEVVIVLAEAAGHSSLGFLIKQYGFLIPSIVLASMATLAFFYVLFIIPETHQRLPGARFYIKRCFTATWEIYSAAGPRRLTLVLVIGMLLFVQLPVIGGSAISTLYQMNHPLCWGPGLIGIFLAVSLLIMQFGSIFGAAVFKRCLTEKYMCLIGDLSGIVSYLFYSMATTTIMVFFVPVIGIFELLPLPLTRAIGSKLVLPSEQGSLFSGMSVVHNLAAIISAVAFNSIYSQTLSIFPGTVFVICAICYTIAFCLTILLILMEKSHAYLHLRGIQTVTDNRESE